MGCMAGCLLAPITGAIKMVFKLVWFIVKIPFKLLALPFKLFRGKKKE